MASAPTRFLDLPNDGAFAVTPSDCVMARSLSASSAESITVPTGAGIVVFAATGDFYANWTTTATVPGDTTDGSASELNPGVRKVAAGATISVIAPAACVVTASFYKAAG